jgi:hypothetical protein
MGLGQNPHLTFPCEGEGLARTCCDMQTVLPLPLPGGGRVGVLS